MTVSGSFDPINGIFALRADNGAVQSGTGPLIAVELFIFLMRPISWFSKILPSYTAYLGLTTLGREGSQYRAPAYLLVLCLTLGVFYASVAKSADIWLVERRKYEVGADLTFEPHLKKRDTGGIAAGASSSTSEPIPPLPTMTWSRPCKATR